MPRQIPCPKCGTPREKKSKVCSACNFVTRAAKITSLVGRVFGRWTVVGIGKKPKATALACTCACGNKGLVSAQSLLKGESQSCGCLRLELSSARKLKHGMTDSPFYHVWAAMKQRCYYPKHVSYPSYGGRGIKICKRWLTFKNFYDDMFATYRPGLSIERKDVNGNYEPSNCCWIPKSDQGKNRRNTPPTFEGQTIREAAARLKMTPGALSVRLRKGWSVKDAYTQPKTNMIATLLKILQKVPDAVPRVNFSTDAFYPLSVGSEREYGYVVSCTIGGAPVSARDLNLKKAIIKLIGRLRVKYKDAIKTYGKT